MTTAATSSKKPRTSKVTTVPPVDMTNTANGELSEDSLLALLGELGDDTAPSGLSTAPLVASDVIDLTAGTTAPVVIVEAAAPSMLSDLKATDAPVIAVGGDEDALPDLQAGGNEDDLPPQTPAPTPKEKKPRTPAMTFASKSDKIAHKLGDKAAEFLILDLADAELDEAQLANMQTELLAAIDKMPIKVGEKATMLFGYLREGGKLNTVMKRAFTTLIADGHLTGGDKGNLITNLLAQPYSIGTARSQATQMFALFPALKICNGREAGKMTINNNSTILAKIKTELGL